MTDKNYNQNNPKRGNATDGLRSGIITFFSQHKVAGNLLMILMILFGAYGLTQMKRQLMPDFGLELITIDVEWSGASAEDVEANIVDAIEPEVRFIDKVEKVTATSYEGRTRMQLFFEADTLMSKALADVQSAVSRITTFPQDIEKPIVTQVIQRDEVCRIDISGPFSDKTLKYFARQMRDDLINMGLANVRFEGARDQEIWIEVPSDNLRELDLTLSDISNRIAASSIDLPSGSINSGDISKQIRSEQLARTPREMRQIEVVSKGSGEKLYLKDIARVFETFQEDSPYRINEKGSSIGLLVSRTRGADSLISQELVQEYMENISTKYPQSLEVVVYDVFSDSVRQRLTMLVENGQLGLLLVLGVLFLFLNGRVALWVAIAIPVAFLGGLGAMSILGMSLDMITMFALILGIGIVVDDTIVVAEHATTLHRRGMHYQDATTQAANRMFAPVLAASLTTMAAFLPVLMVKNEVGEIISGIPITLSLIIVASLVECFLVLPMHLRKSLKKISQAKQTKPRKFDAWFSHFRDQYFCRFSEITFLNKGFTVVATFCMFCIAIALLSSGRVKFEFFALPESDTIHANFTFTPGSSAYVTEAMAKELGRSARAAEDILTNGKGGLVSFGIGSIGSTDTGRGNLITNTTGNHIGSYSVELADGDLRDVRNPMFIKTWEEQTQLLPGLEKLLIFETQAGGPPGRDVDIRIVGKDMQSMKIAAVELQKQLRGVPGLIAVEDDLPFGKEDILLELKPEGEAMGFSAEDVARQVRNSFSGSVAKRFAEDTEEIIVRVKLPAAETKQQTIRDVYLRSPDKTDVLLSEVVTLTKRLGFTRINREDGVTQVSVTGDVDPSVTTTNTVLAIVSQEIAPAIEKQFGVKVEFKGKAEEQAEALGDLSIALILSIASIYIILAWLFSSYTTPLVIMSVVPFGLVGAIVGHYLMDFNLNMFSLMALLGLSGVLVNDSIILVTTIKRFIADGLDLAQAVVEGVRERLRPVLLTTTTTVVGLTPILFEQSLQAQLVQPLAITFIFGMMLSPYLVLIFVPSVMGIGDSLKNKIGLLMLQTGFRKTTI